MKNNELHNFMEALDAEVPTMPAHQARLKQSLSRGLGTHHKKEPFMKRNKKFIGFSSAGMTVAIVASVLVYSYNYSPKALADQMIGRGISHLETLQPVEIDALQQKFGGDPAEALKEAKQAKDAKVISKEDFDKESKAAKGLFATSLSKDGTGPTFSMQRFESGEDGKGLSTMSVRGGASGTVSAGSVEIKEGQATIMSGSDVAISANGVGEGAPNITYSTGGVNVSSAGVSTMAAPAEATTLINGTDGMNPIKIMDPSEAKSFLRYTDKNGRVNVLSLDKEGLPIFRTIFMNASDSPNL